MKYYYTSHEIWTVLIYLFSLEASIFSAFIIFFVIFVPTPILGFLYSSMNSSPFFSSLSGWFSHFTLHLQWCFLNSSRGHLYETLWLQKFLFHTPLTTNRSQTSVGGVVRSSKGNRRTFFWDFCNATVLSEKENPAHRATMSSHESTSPRQYFIQKTSPTLKRTLTFLILKSSNEFLHHFSFTCGGLLNLV